MQTYNLNNHDNSVFESQKDDLQTAIEVICESKQDLNDDWAKEAFDFVAMALKEKEAMQ